MGYPYDDTYLEQIQRSESECQDVRKAYWLLRAKYIMDHEHGELDLELEQEFALLGEAFRLCSDTVGGITDTHHFMWDVLDELLPEDR